MRVDAYGQHTSGHESDTSDGVRKDVRDLVERPHECNSVSVALGYASYILSKQSEQYTASYEAT